MSGLGGCPSGKTSRAEHGKGTQRNDRRGKELDGKPNGLKTPQGGNIRKGFLLGQVDEELERTKGAYAARCLKVQAIEAFSKKDTRPPDLWMSLLASKLCN